VGVAVEIKHLAPTPVGELLCSHARFTGREGKLFWFEVWFEDAAGIVGRGRHSRAAVEIETRAARCRKAA
jgi:fluoroacetyl-CoA thioesterase